MTTQRILRLHRRKVLSQRSESLSTPLVTRHHLLPRSHHINRHQDHRIM